MRDLPDQWRASGPPAPASATARALPNGLLRRDERCQADRLRRHDRRGAPHYRQARPDRGHRGPHHDTATALEAAIDKARRAAIVNAGALGARRARCGRRGMGRGQSAITAHIEAEVARRLAAAPGSGGDRPPRRRHLLARVPPWRRQSSADWGMSRATITPIRAAIAADGRGRSGRVDRRDRRVQRILTAPRAAGVPCPVLQVARPARRGAIDRPGRRHLRGLAADRGRADRAPGPTEGDAGAVRRAAAVCGWVATEIGGARPAPSSGVGSHAVVHGQVWRTANASGSAPTLEAAQLAAEDSSPGDRGGDPAGGGVVTREVVAVACKRRGHQDRSRRRACYLLWHRRRQPAMSGARQEPRQPVGYQVGADRHARPLSDRPRARGAREFARLSGATPPTTRSGRRRPRGHRGVPDRRAG